MTMALVQQTEHERNFLEVAVGGRDSAGLVRKVKSCSSSRLADYEDLRAAGTDYAACWSPGMHTCS